MLGRWREKLSEMCIRDRILNSIAGRKALEIIMQNEFRLTVSSKSVNEGFAPVSYTHLSGFFGSRAAMVLRSERRYFERGRTGPLSRCPHRTRHPPSA